MGEKISARSMAFDADGVPYVHVRRGNEHYLTRLGADDRLEVIRPVAKGAWWFRVDQQVGLFTDDDAVNPITAYDLQGSGRGRKVDLDGESRFVSWHRSTWTCAGLYAVGTNPGFHLYRLEGATGRDLDQDPTAQTDAERSARFYLAGSRGIFTRRLGQGAASTWQQLAGEELARCKQMIYDPVGDRVVVVGTYRGTGKVHLFAADGSLREHSAADGQGYWGAACLAGRLYLYSSGGVIEVHDDGTTTDCGVTGEVVRNQCLFAGEDALYLVCADRLHRLRDGRWSAIDLAGQTLAAAAKKRAPSAPPEPAAPLRGDVAAMLGEVADHQDDLDSLHVLADALQAAGDPRGELIELQCIEQPSPAQRRRVEALLRAHTARWLGPLAEVAARGSVVFHRGFLRELGLKQKGSATAKQLRGCREWATVERLDVSMWPDAATLELLGDPVMKQLRVVEGLHDPATLGELGAQPWHTLSFRHGLGSEGVPALCGVTNLPALRHLTFQEQDLEQALLEPIWECPLVKQLETLTVRCRQLGDVVPLWSEALSHLRRLTILPGGSVEERSGGWELTLSREGGDTALRFKFHWPNPRKGDVQYGRLAAFMSTLPLAAARVEVVPGALPPTPEEKSALVTAARKLGSKTLDLEPEAPRL